MALTKIWAGQSTTDATTTAGDYAAADNWQPISLVNSTYRWLASGSGSSEYYLDLSGGGDPGVAEPANVQEVISGTRTNMAAATAGSLDAGEWDYGDNDTLGYSTIYVRLTGSTDPDASDTKHVTMTAIPAAGDDVILPADATAGVSSNMKQSGVAIADFIVAEGHTYDQGDANNYLEIDPNRAEFHGSGTGYIDIGSANIDVLVTETGQGATGTYGLNLIGSNIATLTVEGSSIVGVAPRAGDTATVADIQARGSAVAVGEGVSLTNMFVHLGANSIACNATKVEVFEGELETKAASAITTMNLRGGRVAHGATGTLGTLNTYNPNSEFDATVNGLDRTITTLNQYGGNVYVDTENVTVATHNLPGTGIGRRLVSVVPDTQ